MNTVITKSKENMLNEFSEQMAKETINLLRSTTKNKDYAEELILRFVSKTLEVVLNETLTSEDFSNTTKYEKAQIVVEKFKLLRYKIAEEIGASFSNSMSKFAGKQIEYVCQVFIVPESNNKTYN